MGRGRLAVAVVVCLTGCKSPPEPTQCAQLAPGRYSFVLTYTGETTFDGGCPPDHAFDGQTITVLFAADGAVTVATPSQTLQCWATSNGYDGLFAHCPLPATNSQLEIGLGTWCDDSGVHASADELVDLSDASFDGLPPACTQSYSAQ
jgi:hypothetical protein